MRCFNVPKDTEVRVIKDGKEWIAPNVKEHVMTKDNLFDLEEMIVDPTGIGTNMACIPGCVTIGSHWAEMSWYGFRRDGYAILIPGDKVEVW